MVCEDINHLGSIFNLIFNLFSQEKDLEILKIIDCMVKATEDNYPTAQAIYDFFRNKLHEFTALTIHKDSSSVHDHSLILEEKFPFDFGRWAFIGKDPMIGEEPIFRYDVFIFQKDCLTV